jgi:hypothetical protein
LCKVIGRCKDGKLLLEAIEELSNLGTGNYTSTSGTPQICRPIGETFNSNLFKYSGPTRRGAKAGCRRCLSLFARGHTKVKHMQYCPSKHLVNENVDDLSVSDQSINVENFSFHSTDTSLLSSSANTGNTSTNHGALINTTTVANNDLLSVDDNSILYNAAFHNSLGSAPNGGVCVQCLEFLNEPVAIQFFPGAKQLDAELNHVEPRAKLVDDEGKNFEAGTNIEYSEVNKVEFGCTVEESKLKKVEPLSHAEDSEVKKVEAATNDDESTLKNVEAGVSRHKPAFQLGDADTRLVDRGLQKPVQFTGAELQVLQLPSLHNGQLFEMYRYAFSDAHHGELASQYVPYINDAEEEHDPLH